MNNQRNSWPRRPDYSKWSICVFQVREVMRLIWLIPVSGAISLLLAGHGSANDSIARVGAGGVILLKTDQIRMVQEVLEISTKTVRVSYRFKNESQKDIRTTVAFPMPAYGWNPGHSAVSDNERPLRPFTLLVGGKATAAKFERRAVVEGRDVTDGLRRAGLSDAKIFERFGDCTEDGCPYSAKQSAQIAKATGKGADYPHWKVVETAYWEQLFPAGVEVRIQHEYPPFVGMSYSAPYQADFGYVGGLPRAAWVSPPAIPDEACIDEGARQALARKIERSVAEGARTVMVTLHDVEYVLGTGRNWKGPIGDFTLRIKKDSADQVISLCFPGKPKIVDSRTFEFRATDFVPQDRLIVHFYSVYAYKK